MVGHIDPCIYVVYLRWTGDVCISFFSLPTCLGIVHVNVEGCGNGRECVDSNKIYIFSTKTIVVICLDECMCHSSMPCGCLGQNFLFVKSLGNPTRFDRMVHGAYIPNA